MKSFPEHSLFSVVLIVWLIGGASILGLSQNSKIETTHNKVKNRTTVRLEAVKISGDKDKYHSLHMSPSFTYPGRQPQIPTTVDFELQTIVKGKLRVDLYVVFIVDGETIFLSSNRWGIKQPIPGRKWMGERLVFNMPYGTLLKIAAARTLEIKMDAVRFEVGEPQMQAIRDFAKHIQLGSSTPPGVRRLDAALVGAGLTAPVIKRLRQVAAD